MAMSDYLEGSILNHILASLPLDYPSPRATLHLALFTADPTDANVTAGEVDVVVDDTAYTRQTIEFAQAVAGVSASSSAETFEAVVLGSGSAAYTVTHFALYDALTAGNLLYHAELSAPVTRDTGKTLLFSAGSVTVAQN